ncbi:MAG: zf-HC2 domain-containing protein [Gemmatimonadaceae bacterium]
MRHLDEGTIHAWLDGALDAAESARVERHVAECDECSEAVAEARGMIAGASRIVAALDVVQGNVIPKSSKATAPGGAWRSLRLTPARAAIAATLLLAVGTMLTVSHKPNRQSMPNAIAGFVDTSSRAAAAPAVAMAPAIASPATAPAVDKRAESTVPSAPATGFGAREQKAAATSSTSARANDNAARGAINRPTELASSTMPAAPQAAASRRDSTRPTSVMALSEIVTTLAGQPHPDSARIDSMAKVAAKSAGIGAASASASVRELTLSAARRGPPALADAALRSSEAPECYRLNSDSGVASFLPREFMLQQTPGLPPQNVVRAVTAEGRIDSAIAGVRWERITPTATRLYMTRSGADLPSTLTLHFADGRVAGALSTAAGPRNIDVSRAVCRP